MSIGGFDNRRGFGLPPAAHVTAQQQLQKLYPHVGIQPLPAGKPSGAVVGSTVGVEEPAYKFVVLGDSGGVKEGTPQLHVAEAMINHLVDDQAIAFAYHIGDEVYFHGDPSNYVSQFYEPYTHFDRPIVGIPGNHDGDVGEDDQGQPTGRLPLDTFMDNFCDEAPHIPICDPQFEYGRHTQTQPYCYWALGLQEVDIIGLYSNVPSGGHLDDDQLIWLEDQLLASDESKPLIVALHHPPFSVDAHHGGSKRMGDNLDSVFTKTGRWPTAVVAGHVHDYQRFTRKVEGHVITYIVIGNSGYHNLHPLARDAHPGMQLQPTSHLSDDSVTFNFGDSHNFGYMVWEVSQGKLAGSYYPVTRQGVAATSPIDAFVTGVA